METALGKMNMSARDFWNLSIYELVASLKGFSDFHSGGKPEPLNKDELQDLMERYPD